MQALGNRKGMGTRVFVAACMAVLLAAAAAGAAGAVGSAAPAYAEEPALAPVSADSGSTAQAVVSPQARSANSKYGLLAKNGRIYPCDKKGDRLAKAWSGQWGSAISIKKLFVAADARKVPARVKYSVYVPILGAMTNNADLRTFSDGVKSVKFLLKGGKNACKTIEANAFSGDGKLKSIVNFKKTKVKTIGQDAFRGTGLKKASFPKSLKTIGQGAFRGCTSLKAVKGLGKTKVRAIASQSFYQTAVKRVSLPKTCRSVGPFAFYQCRSLKSVSLGDRVSLIDASAFYGCSALTNVVLPPSVAQLGVGAFSDCASLRSLTMKSPAMVTSTLGKSAFMTFTINGTAIADANAPAYIYVPRSALPQYQAPTLANPWYQYAAKFRAIP